MGLLGELVRGTTKAAGKRVVLSLLMFLPTQPFAYGHQGMNDGGVIAANWQQYSGEYAAYLYQSFNGATDQLRGQIAAIPPGKKPAIITDIDDTLIPGTHYFASMVDADEAKNPEPAHPQPVRALSGAVAVL